MNNSFRELTRVCISGVGKLSGGPAEVRKHGRFWVSKPRMPIRHHPEDWPGGSASATGILVATPKYPAGADFLFARVFQNGGLVGKKPCLSLPPDWRPWSIDNGPVAQLDRASHYGCEGLGFESLQGHREARLQQQSGFSFDVEGAIKVRSNRGHFGMSTSVVTIAASCVPPSRLSPFFSSCPCFHGIRQACRWIRIGARHGCWLGEASRFWWDGSR